MGASGWGRGRGRGWGRVLWCMLYTRYTRVYCTCIVLSRCCVFPLSLGLALPCLAFAFDSPVLPLCFALLSSHFQVKPTHSLHGSVFVPVALLWLHEHSTRLYVCTGRLRRTTHWHPQSKAPTSNTSTVASGEGRATAPHTPHTGTRHTHTHLKQRHWHLESQSQGQTKVLPPPPRCTPTTPASRLPRPVYYPHHHARFACRNVHRDCASPCLVGACLAGS